MANEIAFAPAVRRLPKLATNCQGKKRPRVGNEGDNQHAEKSSRDRDHVRETRNRWRAEEVVRERGGGERERHTHTHTRKDKDKDRNGESARYRVKARETERKRERDWEWLATFTRTTQLLPQNKSLIVIHLWDRLEKHRNHISTTFQTCTFVEGLVVFVR